MSIAKKVIRFRRNHGALWSSSSAASVIKSSAPMITNSKFFQTPTADRYRFHLPCLKNSTNNERLQLTAIALFSTAKKQSKDKDLSMLSMNELSELATKSLRKCQRQPEISTSTAKEILRHILNRVAQQQLEEDEAEDLPIIQTSLIDSWITFHSSIIREINEAKNQRTSGVDRDEKALQHEQLLQLKRLRELCSAAGSITNILQSMENPTPHHYIALLKAWANTCKIARAIGRSKMADIVGIPQRTQLILSEMKGPNNVNSDISVEAYNEVIKAWAYSSEYLRGTMAEHVFQNIQFPTGESFRMVMRAHAWSNESRSAFQATGHFMRMMRLLEAGRDDMEPSSIDDYHILCDAWTKAGDKNTSSKVYSVLQIMNNAYEKGYTSIRPDLQCYRDALITMSRRQNVEDVGDWADETLKEMKDRMIFPDTKCYRSAILAWKHVAMSRDCVDPEQAIRRTQELLQEMTEAYHRSAQILVQTTTEDYNHVLQAMNLSKKPQTVDYAQDLFQTLKDETSSTGGPDAQSYRYMLGILRNSRSPKKNSSASQLLEEVTDKYTNDENWRASKSSKESAMDVFTEFVRVCGAPTARLKNITVDLQHDRRKMMTNALQILGDSRKLGLTPNSNTYTALLEACDCLLPVYGQERENILENVFRQACAEGFVDPSLLESFKSAASTYLYSKLVVSKSVAIEGIKIVPESWTRNVDGYREGKKVMPLSIEGDFTFTRSAAEYRMRKLRRRTNQKFLRGGRLK